VKHDTNIVSRVLREAWDGRPVLQTMTKHNPSIATDPIISVAAHVTAHELREKLDKLAITDGFGNRFLFCCAERSKLLPFGGNIEDTGLDQLAARLSAALQAAQQLDRIIMDEAAKPRWAEFYMATEEPARSNTGELIEHLTARAAPQVLRLALVHALFDGSAKITLPHVNAAIAIWQYCEASARYVFDTLSGDRVADTILDELNASHPDGLSRSEIIHDVFGRNVHAGDISRALRKLQTAGKARCEKRKAAGGRGRPSEVWFTI
jgi:hypothetical protein